MYPAKGFVRTWIYSEKGMAKVVAQPVDLNEYHNEQRCCKSVYWYRLSFIGGVCGGILAVVMKARQVHALNLSVI